MNGAELLLGPDSLARHAERAALICDDEAVSFGVLARQMRKAAGAFAACGVSPGERVVLMMRDTPEFAAAWLGAVYAGVVPVALNNKLGDADYRHALADSGARLALVDESFAAARPAIATDLPAFRAKLGSAPEAAPYDADPEAPAFLLYSSGTTGKPKGIIHTHRGFRSLGLAFRAIGLGPGERIFTTSKFFFAYGLEHGLLATLALGATSVVHPDWPDVQAVVELVTRHRPSAMFSVPTVFRRLLAEPRAKLQAFAGVRHAVAGGERLSRQLVEQWHAAFGSELLNLYGMSETFCACMMTRPGTSDGIRTGLPFDGVEVELRDAAGAAAPPGEPGVLWVRHPAQSRGYANLPQQTQAQFRDGWFCSRDIFERDAHGFFIHHGRSDELLKIAGQWVQPGELEAVAEQVPAIAEAACVPVADEQGLERLALFVTARVDAADAARAAAEACERLLPRHKRPKWVRAVEELPRTATGKVQRFKLREILQRELRGKD